MMAHIRNFQHAGPGINSTAGYCRMNREALRIPFGAVTTNE